MSSIDFDQFHRLVCLADVVKACGLDQGRRNVLWRRAQCPFCLHSDCRALSINWETSNWHCHRCYRGGGPIQFAQLALKIGNPWDAVHAVCKKLGLTVPYKPRVRTKRRARDRTGDLIDDDTDDAIA